MVALQLRMRTTSAERRTNLSKGAECAPSRYPDLAED
jgi:hypothetical protein